MAAFRFSRRAEADLLSIGEYTLRTWGRAQAARYIGELEVCCQTLSDNPALGRLCDEIRPGLRRLEHGKHVVFYRQEGAGMRAHYRAAQRDTFERINAIGTHGIPLRWTKNFPNGARDLSNPPEFVVSDPDLAELEKLFNSPDTRSE